MPLTVHAPIPHLQMKFHIVKDWLNKTLRRKLAVAATALTVGLVVVTGGLTYSVALNITQSSIQQTLQHEGALAARSLEIALSVIESGDATAALVRIADTGIGIAQDEQPRLFERFHRVEGAQGRSFEGTGIGLALVQDLARLHGARIEVESTVGRGTTFTIRVPFGHAHLPQDQISRSASSDIPLKAQPYLEEARRMLPDADTGLISSETTPAELAAVELPRESLPGFGRRVLLADDNADMRDYVRRLLETHGYTVDTAADGEAALASARRSPPDLVLTDVMMPKLDGFGVLRGIRADTRLVETPVLMLSARAGEEAKVEALDAAADDYLAKPFAERSPDNPNRASVSG